MSTQGQGSEQSVKEQYAEIMTSAKRLNVSPAVWQAMQELEAEVARKAATGLPMTKLQFRQAFRSYLAGLEQKQQIEMNQALRPMFNTSFVERVLHELYIVPMSDQRRTVKYGADDGGET